MFSHLSFKHLFGISFARFITIILIVVALLIGLGVYFGRVTSPSSSSAKVNKPAAAATTTPASTVTVTNITVTAPAATCQDTDPERAKRNVVWRTLNGELLPDSPERAIALGLLPFVHTDTGYALQDGVDRIVNRFTAYYGAEQRARMFHTLNNGTAEDRVETVRRILVADRAATNLLECILRDEGRMQLATSRQPVPLE